MKNYIFKIVSVDDGSSKASRAWDISLIFLILINVGIIILHTFEGIPESISDLSYLIEAFTMGVFSVEYVVRVWTADLIYPEMTKLRSRLAYVISPMAFFDLLALLPFYMPGMFPEYLSVLRMFRLVWLFKLIKRTGISGYLTSIVNILRRKAPQLIASMVVLFVFIITTSVLIYTLEHEAQPDVFKNAFSGIWWSVTTITTIGYGDVYPMTFLGQALNSVMAILSVGLVAVPTGIISVGFIEEMRQREISAGGGRHTYCPHCGSVINKNGEQELAYASEDDNNRPGRNASAER